MYIYLRKLKKVKDPNKKKTKDKSKKVKTTTGKKKDHNHILPPLAELPEPEYTIEEIDLFPDQDSNAIIEPPFDPQRTDVENKFVVTEELVSDLTEEVEMPNPKGMRPMTPEPGPSTTTHVSPVLRAPDGSLIYLQKLKKVKKPKKDKEKKVSGQKTMKDFFGKASNK